MLIIDGLTHLIAQLGAFMYTIMFWKVSAHEQYQHTNQMCLDYII